MLKIILLGIVFYFLLMIGIIYAKYKLDKKKHPNMTFLVWLNERIAQLNTAILLKGADWQTKRYEKLKKKQNQKKKKALEKMGFK